MRRISRSILAAVLACAVLSPLAIRAELDGGYALETFRAWRRDLADHRFAASLQSVPCPKSALVLAALGQSNAGNHVGGRVPADPTLPAFAFFRDRCVPLSDPIPGATGKDGSLWTALAHRLARERGEAVVVVAGAAAGSSVRHWVRDSAGMRTRALRSIEGAARAGLPPSIFFWLQGEADGETRMTQQAYERHLENVIQHVNSRLAVAIGGTLDDPPPWIITQTSRCWTPESRSEDIRAAQRAVAAKVRNGQVGPDTDALDERFRADGCHFNDAGRSAIIEALIPRLVAPSR